MENLTPKFFFDLSVWAHQSLFSNDQPVWETLKNITPYLKSLELGKIQTEIPKGVTLVKPESISIGEGTVIQSGAYIEGPCLIGKQCEVRHGAYIRGGVITGNGCVLGHSTELKQAILLDHAHAPHFNYVGDSILGNHVNLGAGVICANFRLDHGEVVIQLEGESMRTKLKKFGAIIGDHSQLGCNSVTNPGILLRKKTYCRPCSSLQRSNVKRGPVRDVSKPHQTQSFSS